MSRQDLDEMARRRCLAVLSLMSGERTMTEAAEAAQCSPLTLQKYEKRAVEAMIVALMPDASPDGVSTSTSKRIADLEARIAQLETAKRRSERLLILTRQLIKAGPVTTGSGRRPGRRSRRKSDTAGAESSATRTTTSRSKAPPIRPPSSTAGAPKAVPRTTNSTSDAATEAPSTPTKDGAAAP
jgi:hypothetical protein